MNERLIKPSNTSTNRGNFVENSPVFSEITRLERVQQASISTEVSLTKFAKERRCQALHRTVLGLVSPVFARGRHRHATRGETIYRHKQHAQKIW